MKLFVCLALAINCVFAAHLGNTYIPPPAHAGSAGGSSFLSTPNRGGATFASHTSTSNHQFGGSSGHGASFGSSAASQVGHFAGGQQQNYQQNSYTQQGSYQQQSSGQQIPIIKFENQPNAGDGSFSYAYETGNGISANAQGQQQNGGTAVQGAYSYSGDDGQNYAITYTADENGYRPMGAHLPTPPPIPAEIQKALELIARNPPQGAENGAYVHSNAGSYNHQGAGGYGQQQQHQGSYQQQQGGHQQSSFSSHTSSSFGGHRQQQQQNFGGHAQQHGSFGAASSATSQHYLPPNNNGYKY